MRNKWPARFLTLRAPRHNSFPPLMSLSGQSASQETKFAALGHRDMSRPTSRGCSSPALGAATFFGSSFSFSFPTSSASTSFVSRRIGPRGFAGFAVASLFFRELLCFFKVDLLIHCDCTVECVDHRQLNAIRDRGSTFSSYLPGGANQFPGGSCIFFCTAPATADFFPFSLQGIHLS